MENSKFILQRIDKLLLNAQSFDSELRILRNEVDKSAKEFFKTQVVPDRPAPAPVQEEKKAATPPPMPPTVQTPVAAMAAPQPKPAEKAAPKPAQAPTVRVTSTSKPVPKLPPVYRQGPPPIKAKKTFFERFPQLEKLLGEKLIPFIGILVLVTGIGFFVSYAINKGWINEYARAGIGILAGGVLIGIAHRMRNSYRAFSSILLGGGIATLYFTIFYAYQEYELFSQGVAFSIMAVITLFTTITSLFYDRKEIAILGLVGGFVSPLLVGNGSGDFVVLFSYMLLLNVGMTVLAYFKDWKLLNVLGFIFTVILFGGRMFMLHGTEHFSTTGFLVFATAFFVLFFIQNIAYNLGKGIKFKVAEYLMLMVNTGAYFGVGMYILNDVNDGLYLGLFTASLAVFNFIFAAVLYKNRKLDQNLIYALIGLVLTFLTLAAPIQLDGNHITLFWAAECVVLLFLSQRTKLSVLRSGSVIVAICMLVSLVMDWGSQFMLVIGWGSENAPILPIIANKLFITTMVSLAALIVYNFLLSKEDEENHISIFGLELVSVKGFKKVFPFITVIFIYLGGLLEMRYQVMTRVEVPEFRTLITVLYHMVFVIGVYAYLVRFKNNLVNGMAFAGSILTILTFLWVNFEAVSTLRNEYLMGVGNGQMFAMHFIGFALTAFLLFRMSVHFRKDNWLVGSRAFGVWALGVVGTVLLCLELDHLMVLALTDGTTPALVYENIGKALQTSHKAGYPVLWGGVAFLFIVNGLKRNYLHLRLFGLSLLGLTLLKIFAIDVWEMGELGRIIAFLSLGILILVIAFLYQRIRKLFIEDTNQAAADAAAQNLES